MIDKIRACCRAFFDNIDSLTLLAMGMGFVLVVNLLLVAVFMLFW